MKTSDLEAQIRERRFEAHNRIIVICQLLKRACHVSDEDMLRLHSGEQPSILDLAHNTACLIEDVVKEID